MDPQWEEALASAVAGEPPDAGVLLFFEQRQDAVVRVRGGDGSPSAMGTRSAGLAASSAGYERVLHRGGAAPEDAALLVRALRGAAAPDRRFQDSSSVEGSRSFLPIREVTALLERAVRRLQHLAPSSTVEADWVGFRQEVLVARPGAPLGRDVRQGGRVRLQARAATDHGLAAVAETVLPLDLRGAGRLVEHLPDQVASRLGGLARAQTMPSGERTVVLAPGISGILVHEIVGHALEADVVLAGRSWLGSAPGPVAAAGLTVIDDPRRSRAPWKIDDEGEPARPTALLRRGRVDQWLQDARTSRLSSRRPTGHARRSSFRDAARPRMGCTFVAAGSHHPLEALEGLADGVYVRRMEAAATDPATGTATFRVTDADSIRDGRIEAPLHPHLLLVEGTRALATIDVVASDLAFDPCAGSCVRDGQALATSVGGPTLRLLATMVAS